MIHEKAFVDNYSFVHQSAKVWQFASVILGARIDEKTVIGPCAMINGSEIGRRCLVSYGVNMGPGFKVHDDVFLGPEVVLCNDTWPRTLKDHFDVDRFKAENRYAVIIERGASLGVRVTVLPGVRIGRNAMIGAHAVVTKDVPDNHILFPSGKMEPIRNEGDKLINRMRFARDVSEPPPSLSQEQQDLLGVTGFDEDRSVG